MKKRNRRNNKEKTQSVPCVTVSIAVWNIFFLTHVSTRLKYSVHYFYYEECFKKFENHCTRLFITLPMCLSPHLTEFCRRNQIILQTFLHLKPQNIAPDVHQFSNKCLGERWWEREKSQKVGHLKKAAKSISDSWLRK